MKNRNLQIGSNFLQKSLYDTRSLQDGRQEWHPKEQIPLPFKVYQKTEHYPLHQVPPLTLGDPRRAFYLEEAVETRAGTSPIGADLAVEETTARVARGQAASSPPRDFAPSDVSSRRSGDDGDLDTSRPLRSPAPTFISYESLSTLLYYTYGFSRHDEGAGVSWPFHRFVASARCFFPTELYLWLPQTEHIPAGVYHYDNLHHSLALIREGEYRDLIAQAVDTDLNNCLGVLLISAHFWKTAFKYINFAYRLCTQEAGIVTSNALIVAATLGYVGRVHYQFLDQPLNRLLGFVPDEESLMAVVPLYTGNIQDHGTGEGAGSSSTHLPNHCVYDGLIPPPVWPDGPCPPLAKPPLRLPGAKTTALALSETIIPLTPDYAKTTTFDRQLCSILTEMDQHTFLEHKTEIITELTIPNTLCLTTDERIALPASSPEVSDLAEALHFRSSGDMNFLPLCLPLKQEVFGEIVRYGLTAYNSDLQYSPSSPRLQLYIVVQHVEGIDAGIYR